MTDVLHKYEILAGRPKVLTDTLENSRLSNDQTSTSQSDDFIKSATANNDFLVIDDLQFTATVNYAKEGKGKKTQPTEYKIMNLSEKSRKYFQKGNTVILKGGYEYDDQLPLISVAQVIKSYTDNQGDTDVTTVVCGDSYLPKRKLLHTMMVPAGTLYQIVINDLLGVFARNGVPTGLFYGAPLAGKKLNRGMSKSGRLSDILTEICEALDYRWYIVLGQIYVVPINQAPEKGDVFEVVQITEESVKGNIRELSDSSVKKAVEDKDTSIGLKIHVQLNGNINVADGVRITFGQYKGIYLVTNVSHKLDFEGNVWDTIIECKN